VKASDQEEAAMTDMTISDIRIIPLRVPWVDPPVFGKSRVTAPRDILVVEIETKGGLVGIGYLHLLSPSLRTIATCLDEAIVPALIGRDATAIEAIWRDLWRITYTAGRMGIAVMAISAIDIALWDLVGKAANMPLHRLWGHFRSEIPAYGSGCWRGLGGDGMIEKALGYVTQGYSAIKMQVAHIHDRHADLTNVRRMREAVGPEIEIMIDVNMGWSADVALQMGRKFQDYDVYWLEEPVPAEDFAGYLRLAEALDLRIVGGETHFTRYDLRPFLENPKLPILQPDVMRGGLTEIRKIAALADTWGMSLAPHLFPELMVQVMASIPNGIWLEQMGWLDDLWVANMPVVNGMIRAPERPGHGLAFRPEVMRDHRVK
jgi:L-alanine-DL-glutamate epimerase-like enolase superfamily enzyme